MTTSSQTDMGNFSLIVPEEQSKYPEVLKNGGVWITLFLLSWSVIAPPNSHSQLPDLDYLMSKSVKSTIRSLLQGVEIDYIDLDDSEPVEIAPIHIIGSDNPYEHQAVYLGASKGLDLVGDTLVVADYKQNRIVFASRHSRKFDRLGGAVGTGPGEFQKIQSVFSDRDYIFVVDSMVRGLLIFDQSLSYIDQLKTGNYIWNSNDAGGGVLAVSGPRGSKSLIAIHRSEPPFEKIGEVLPALVPDGHPLSLYNKAAVVVSDVGEVAGMYYGIPIVFLYGKDQQLTRAIVISSYYLEHLNTDARTSNGIYSMRSGIYGFEYGVDGDIIFSTNEGMHVLRESDGRYRLFGSFRLEKEPHESGFVAPFGIRSVNRSSVFVVSRGESRVFQYVFPANEHIRN